MVGGIEVTVWKTKAIGVMALLATAAVLLGAACGGPKDVALQVAQDWTDDSMEQIASESAELLVGEVPLLKDLAASAIEGQIREKVSWGFATPIEKGNDRYEVVATASVAIDVDLPLLPDKSYDASLDFSLQVDVNEAKVASWLPVVSSVSFEER